LLEKQFITRSLIILLSISSFCSFGQERYYDIQFGVGVKYNVEYGYSSSPKEKSKELLLDVYYPLNDRVTDRPLLILAHGGGYVMGNKNNYPVETMCSRFAQMGYVCASINYSKQFEKKGTANDRASKTVLKAVQDMKAAIRFFRSSADSGNVYGINSDIIWVGGSSSGAITALHCAFTQENYFDSIEWNLSDYGGLEGTGGNQNYSSNVQGVISISGALGDTSMIQKNIPVVMLHSSFDPIVPFGKGKIHFEFPLLPEVPPADVMGSLLIEQKLNNEGIPNDLYVFQNQGHVPFDKTLQWKHYPFYMDLTINFVRNFMFNQIHKGANKTNMTDKHTSQIRYERDKDGIGWHFYPVDKNVMKIKLFVVDESGKILQKRKVKKKRKSFYWKSKKLPNNFKLVAVYNTFRTEWKIRD